MYCTWPVRAGPALLSGRAGPEPPARQIGDLMLTRRARGAAITTVLGLLGLTGLAATTAVALGPSHVATAARTVASTTGSSTTGARYPNVGNTHSPELEQLLAGSSARSAPVVGNAVTRDAATSAPAGASSVLGVDVASYQHPQGAAINWSQVAAGGTYKFAFVKTTEGNYYINKYATADLAQAHAAGLYVAPYAFANPFVAGGATEADYALDHTVLPAGSPALPIILDIEYDPYAGLEGTNTCYGLSNSQMVSWISAFVSEATRRTGQRPIIYSTAQWWNECTGKSTAFTADPLWIAGDSGSGSTLQPIMPPGWKTWTYWQYTSGATVPGIDDPGQTDTSYLSASALALLDPPAQSDATGASVSLPEGALTAQTVTFTASGLPSGLSISPSTGVISGVLPARAASFPIKVTATPTAGTAVTQAFTWDVHGAVRLTRPRAQTSTVGSPALLRVAVADSLSGCTLRLTASGLPAGLSMNSCGVISGWPQVSKQYQVQVTASDSTGAALATTSFGWRVRGAGTGGATGLIHLNASRCLDASHSAAVVGRCSGSAATRWTVVQDGTFRLGSNCLSAAGATVSLVPCSRHGAVRWQLTDPSGETPAQVANLTSGLCLADTSTRSGARADAAKCTGSAAEQWTLPAGQLASGVPGYCVSDYHRSGPVTGQVSVRTCSRSAQESWTIRPDGLVQIGAYCLTLQHVNGAAGTEVVLARCHAVASQTWEFSGGPFGAWLISKQAGLCLSDPGDRARNGTGLVLGYCQQSDPGITWRLS
jgi:GH25 family lysozyme M1 (1,4-beta-N-acetylmuramidase)